jgi:hypothetical protein
LARQRSRAPQSQLLDVPVIVPPHVATPTSALTPRLDDKRSAEQLTIPLLGHFLVIGGELGTTARYHKDVELG